MCCETLIANNYQHPLLLEIHTCRCVQVNIVRFPAVRGIITCIMFAGLFKQDAVQLYIFL